MVTAEFNGCKMTTARQSLYQYDYEQQLQINGLALPEVFQADFCNAGDASTVSVLGENDVVDIPAQFIADGRDILAYVFYYDEATGGKTRAEITITVMARPERTDEQPTPEQESIIDQAIDALNEGVERAENAADNAEGYAGDAETAKNDAEAAKEAVEGLGVTAHETAAGSGPSVEKTVNPETGAVTLDFGLPAAPVSSVNGQTGEVTLDAEDVGALPDSATLDDIQDGATYKRATGAQLQQIGANAADVQELRDNVDAIEAVIPNQASAQNQLADKAFVNSSIQTSSAHFRGNWPTWADVPTDAELYPVDDDGNRTPTSNDYMVLQDASGYPAGDDPLEGTWRFKFSGVWAVVGRAGWHPEYQVNETPLTAAQLDALNSGATAALIAQITANETAIQGKQDKIAAAGLLKGDGAGGVSAAVAGTDYVPPSDYAPEAKTAAMTQPVGKDTSGKLWTEPGGGGDVTDVQINGTSIVQDGVANVPLATAINPGVALIQAGYGLTMFEGIACIAQAPNASVKAGENHLRPICPSVQHAAAFYGLAKAAGDTTQSASSNNVGNYTETAKSKISEMLNSSVTVSGTTPTITALPGVRYVCGEVATLDITLPSSGVVDVTFESGSTATVLTITPPTGVTLKWANGFDPTSLEANTTYEINVCDGLGVAGTWT